MVDKDRLLSIIGSFENVPFTVVGDLILDHYVWGTVDRISPEAPVVVVQVASESKRLGGAANVTQNLQSLGANVLICGVVGEDQSGKDIIANLNDIGADTSGVIVEPGRATTRKTRVVAHAQQVVRIDREVNTPLKPETEKQLIDKFSGSLVQTKGVIVSDYAKGAISENLFKVIDAKHKEGIFGPGAVPLLIDPKDPNFPLYSYATVIKPNRKEAQEASRVVINKRSDAVSAGKSLLSTWNTDMVLITLGEMGMVLISGEESVEVDTFAREVFDVSGAGDTVSAAFLLSLSVGGSPEESAAIANFAAGIVVREIGTAAISLSELRSEIEKS